MGDTGAKLGYYGYRESANDVWPWGPSLFRMAELIFGCFFLAELILKAITLGRLFVRDPWNWLDVFLVAVWLLEQIGTSVLPLDPTVLKMARLVRLFRLLKLARAVDAFGASSLFIMITAIRGSLSVLFWTCMLL